MTDAQTPVTDGNHAPQKTPLAGFHLKRGGRMVDFAGWHMPILYDTIIKEHQFVRSKIGAGLFDVSHMGRLWLEGPGARKCLEYVLTRYVSDMVPGQCRYAIICNQDGGAIDDVIVYKFELGWMLVVNAANRENVVRHIEACTKQHDWQCRMEDRTYSTAMVALQGDLVVPLMDTHLPGLSFLSRYQFMESTVLESTMIISRTGYTGEEGVEIILPANQVDHLMNQLDKYLDDDNGDALSEMQQAIGRLGLHADDFDGAMIRPIGLGARDTLRMEAGMPLYGHELNAGISPIEAGLKFAVSFAKHEKNENDGPRVELVDGESFCGEKRLKEKQDRKLIGLKAVGRRAARQGAKIVKFGELIGEVTSGCFAPTINQPIAMALVDAELASDLVARGEELEVDLGSSQIQAQAVRLPFYKRS